jgi:hypothetical protein
MSLLIAALLTMSLSKPAFDTTTIGSNKSAATTMPSTFNY